MSNEAGGGLSLASVLVVIFVVLKLVHVIDWSWWWVFSPWLISFGLGLLIVAIVALFDL